VTRSPLLWIRKPARWARRPPRSARGSSSSCKSGIVLTAAAFAELGVVVDEHRERHLLLLDKRRRVSLITGPDRDEFSSRILDVLIVLAQLRGVLTAEQSTEMSQEGHDDRLVRPVVT
jgi:hypothetical protein